MNRPEAHLSGQQATGAAVDGAAGFFAKPVDDARLLVLIDEILRK